MPNVVRFALDSARTLYVPGAGTFVEGILDIDANNLAAVGRARFRVQPYRAIEIGIVDSATPLPSLPAAPGDVVVSPDPYPQYLTDSEFASLIGDTIPRLDELFQSVRLPDVTAAISFPLVMAPYPCELQQVSFGWLANLAASDTNYWTVDLRRHRAGEVSIIATKTTKATLGQAVTTGQEWNFDTVVFPDAGFVKGDLFSVRFTPTGTPGPLTGGVATFRMPPADVEVPTALFADTFDRANETVLNIASDGTPWSRVVGVGVVSNQAKSSQAAAYAVKDLSVHDVQMTATLLAFGTTSSPGFYINFVDLDNTYSTNASQVTKRVGAVGSTIDSAFDNGLTLAAGDRMRAIRTGASIYIYIDKGNTGEFALASTLPGQTDLATQGGFGLRCGGNGVIWENFSIVSAG